MKYFTMANLPMTLLIVGIAMNAIDTVTAKNGGGGVLFNPQDGFLKGIDSALPDYNLPGTNIRVNLGGYIVAIGGGWLIFKQLS